MPFAHRFCVVGCIKIKKKKDLDSSNWDHCTKFKKAEIFRQNDGKMNVLIFLLESEALL